MTLKNKIYTVAGVVFIIFILIALMNLLTYREILKNIRVRDNVKEMLDETEVYVEWKNHFIQSVRTAALEGKVSPETADLIAHPSFSMKDRFPLLDSGRKLLERVGEGERAASDTEASFKRLQSGINRLYFELDEKIATALAGAQMNQVLGLESTDKVFLAPYLLKSLNQLTLLGLNNLISMSFSEESRRVVEKNRLFITSQLSIIDTQGDIKPLFEELFLLLESIDNFIQNSAIRSADIESKILSAETEFNSAAEMSSSDSLLDESRKEMERANEELEKTSRRTLITVVLLSVVIPVLVIILGMLGLNAFIIKPIFSLRDIMKNVESGNFKIKAPVHRRDEIGMLAHAFNVMAGEIELKIKELRKAHNYIASIINSMPSVLIGVDADGRITQWNSEASRITGVSPQSAEGRNLTEIFPSNDIEDKIRKAVRTRKTHTTVKESKNRNGEIVYEDLTIYPLVSNGVEGAVIRIDDVTEKVRLEEMMVQSEKMLSVGGLAAGMAHEINNPMAGILQTSEVLISRLKDSKGIPANRKAAEEAGTSLESIDKFMESRGILRMLDNIVESGKRISDIVDNMLSFARKPSESSSTHFMEELLDRTLELASTDYDLKKKYDFKRIKVFKEYTDTARPVPCESSKIQQVLLNLLRNGAQAMESAGTDTPQFILRTYFSEENEMVCVEIEDNGPGMDEVTRKRVFEPFFTTKPEGAGTGLGLSVSYFIITENHGGEMKVESRPGFGTKFIMRLPTVP